MIPNISFHASLFGFLCTRVESYMNRLMRCRFLRVEILYESRVGI
jgi:hypothetical protein